MQTGNKPIKRCSKPLIITERQLNATVGHHPTPIRMATVKTNKQKSESDGKDMGNLKQCPAIKISVVAPQKIKNKLAIWSNRLTHEYMPKINKSRVWKKYVCTYVHSSIIYSSQNVKTLQQMSVQ